MRADHEKCIRVMRQCHFKTVNERPYSRIDINNLNLVKKYICLLTLAALPIKKMACLPPTPNQEISELSDFGA